MKPRREKQHKHGAKSFKAALMSGVVLAGSLGAGATYLSSHTAEALGSNDSGFCVTAVSDSATATRGNCVPGTPETGGPIPTPPKEKNDSNVMVTRWDTSLPGCTYLQIGLAGGVGSETMTNWGDGTPEQNSATVGRQHTYAAPQGEVTITLTGTFKEMRLGTATEPSSHCIVAIDSWGSGTETEVIGSGLNMLTNLSKFAEIPDTLTDLEGLFYRRDASALPALDLSGWDTSNVTNMNMMFQEAKGINESTMGIADWDVSNVKTAESMFLGSTSNGADLSQWKFSNLTSTKQMFLNSDFNGDISDWDTSKVESTEGMFISSQFNGDISEWDTSSLTNMKQMFSGSKFNNGYPAGASGAVGADVGLNKWDTSNVTAMNSAFAGDSSFNQDISEWDVTAVTSMYQMFGGASSFDRDLSKWSPQNTADFAGVFAGTKVSADLSKWNVDSATRWWNFAVGTPIETDLEKIPAKFHAESPE